MKTQIGDEQTGQLTATQMRQARRSRIRFDLMMRAEISDSRRTMAMEGYESPEEMFDRFTFNENFAD